MIKQVLESIKTQFLASNYGNITGAMPYCLFAALFISLMIPSSVLAQESSRELAQTADYQLIHDLRKNIAFDPFRKDSWQKLGEAYCRTAEYKKAEEAILSGLSLDSKSADLWNDLGDILYRQSRYAESTDAYKKASALQKSREFAASETRNNAPSRAGTIKCVFSSMPTSVIEPEQNSTRPGNEKKRTAARLDSGF
jgi:tetratricopeptide (TPR) repeat protein